MLWRLIRLNRNTSHNTWLQAAEGNISYLTRCSAAPRLRVTRSCTTNCANKMTWMILARDLTTASQCFELSSINNLVREVLGAGKIWNNSKHVSIVSTTAKMKLCHWAKGYLQKLCAMYENEVLANVSRRVFADFARNHYWGGMNSSLGEANNRNEVLENNKLWWNTFNLQT